MPDKRDLILEWAGRVKGCDQCCDEWPCQYHSFELDLILGGEGTITEPLKALAEAQGDEPKFKSIYRKYVIREKTSDMFVGPTSEMYRVALRRMAARFTKDEAMEYIAIKKGSHFFIEDAT